MSGITTGSRQFNFMLPMCQITWTASGEVITANNGWELYDAGGNNRFIYYQSKLDLRALLDGDAKGLDIMNISVQESLPWACHKNSTLTPYVMDVITTVKPTPAMIGSWLILPPGFRGSSEYPSVDLPTSGVGVDAFHILNPSQVIWGLWRYYCINNEMPNDLAALEVQSSSSFGDGEVAVSPQLYHTRIVSYAGGFNQVLPAANLVCAAQVISLTEGQEFTQMIRGSQR